ncbi:MAG: response regulator [Desulfobulbus sp.]|nr:MAG: response regulator [Desulfobulbus sp.]
MKKKIIISFLSLFLLFFAGIVITLYIVGKTTANLNSLLALHKVEIIRQDLVINVQNVQSNLYTTGTLFGKELDIIVDNVLKLQDRVLSCNDCHHNPPVAQGLAELEELTEQYKEALSYFITSTADTQRIERLQAVAADIGDTIIARSQDMALTANEALRRKTTDALEKVNNSRKILAYTLLFALFVVVGISFYLIRSITRPVAELLQATRKIRQGELGYVSSFGGEAEFKELIASFNDMSLILLANHENILAQMARNQTILQSTTDGFALVDDHGRIVDANPSLCRMTELGREALLVMHFADLLDLGGGLSAESLLARIREAGSLVYQVDVKAGDGGTVPVEVSATYVEMEGNGSYFCFLRDLSERKKMETELIKGQKLESLGVLAGGIAHDFNNLLTGIIGYIDLTLRTLTPGEKNHGWLENAKKASARAQGLTQQLLTFSRGGEPVKSLVQVKELLEESTRFVLSGSNVKCAYRIADHLWAVNADKGQISQVIQNITLNGAQAMSQGGTITVAAENYEAPLDNPHNLAPGKYVRLEFADQGSGIARKDLAKIFDPYFSTKKTGTGLGLTICHSIVSKHNGRITVESELGVGTRFTIFLPAVEEGRSEQLVHLSGVVHGSGRILVMDDEEHVRAIVGEMLTYLGYEVGFAQDGAEAIDLYARAKLNGSPYDVVIMDLTIPGGMGGRETVSKLREIDPDVKAIVSSGYSNDPVLADFRAYGFQGIASKPFDTEGLSRVLHEIITG